MGVTAICSKCQTNKAYFNGIAFECPICNYIWKGDVKSLNFQFVTNTDKFKVLFDKIEKLRIEKKKPLDALKLSYTPSWIFFKNLILFAETGHEESYYNEICKTLILTKNYSEIIKIKPEKSLSNDKIDTLFKRAIVHFLESRDELKFYPTPIEWSQYIGAPISLIDEILKDRKPHILHFLPMTDEEDFSIYFQTKMKKNYMKLKRKMDKYELSYSDLGNAFSCIINQDRDNYIDIRVFDEIQENFSFELTLFKQYRIDMDNWKNGSLDKFYKIAKENRLSNIDTISLVLDFYFKDLTNLDY